mmetsp:Transcript_101687/g.270486  ORF Transcript_101687/g.270486 Transcript_101687/m.270486 type:complete len:210 (-) Transcript_101687:143-772(-)
MRRPPAHAPPALARRRLRPRPSAVRPSGRGCPTHVRPYCRRCSPFVTVFWRAISALKRVPLTSTLPSRTACMDFFMSATFSKRTKATISGPRFIILQRTTGPSVSKARFTSSSLTPSGRPVTKIVVISSPRRRSETNMPRPLPRPPPRGRLRLRTPRGPLGLLLRELALSLRLLPLLTLRRPPREGPPRRRGGGLPLLRPELLRRRGGL